MASKTLIPVEEYLKSSFDGPDCEFVEGEIIERNLGSKPHSKAQMRLLLFFDRIAGRHALHIYPDLRVRLSVQLYRVPDIAVYFGEEPAEDIPSYPPNVAIEIVSADDRHTDILKKLADYHAWGVKRIWSVDPWTRKLFVYDNSGYHEVPAYDLPECGAGLTAAELFADQTPQQ